MPRRKASDRDTYQDKKSPAKGPNKARPKRIVKQ